MANVVFEKEYSCFDDCMQSGCPSHKAVLSFQSTSNHYTFDNGKGKTYSFEQGELEAMILLLSTLSENRADSLHIRL